MAERLIVWWREGKVTVGEIRHEHDWSKTFYYSEESTPQAYGIWLLQGETDEPLDFKAANLQEEREEAPIRGEMWRLGDLEVGLETCAPFGRAPSASIRLRFANQGFTPISRRFALMLRTATERTLVFSAPDLYSPYAPELAPWLAAKSTWRETSPGVWRDGARFLATGDAQPFSWDAAKGCVRFDVTVGPGEEKTLDFVLGEGEVEKPAYEQVRDRTRADWRKELARVADRTRLVRLMAVQMLQCFSRPIGKDCVLPRQGCLQRWVWPGDQQYVSLALGLLGYGEYVEGALDFYFDEYLDRATGEVGPFGNGWACDSACVLYMFSRYCLDAGNERCWRRRCGDAERIFSWIKAKRRESAGHENCREGLFPPMKASDAAGEFQAWGITDIYNLMAVETFAAAMERFDGDRASPFRAESDDYRSVIAEIVDLWRKKSAHTGFFRLPIDPLGIHDDVLLKRNYFFSHPGRFAALGFLDEDDMLRVRNWMISEGYAHSSGLYMRCRSWRCWDTGKLVAYDVADNVWYTTATELFWYSAWRRVGRDDLARQALDSCLKYAVTREGAVGERFCTTTPWYFPWSPNASGAGRIVLMLLGKGVGL